VAESSASTATPEKEKKKLSGFSKLMSATKGHKSSSSSTHSTGTAASNVGGATTSSRSSVKSPVLSATGAEHDKKLASNMDRLSISSTKGSKENNGQRRITFITEQVSHHPPISSFFVECKDSGVQLCGVDQLSAKFTGTSIRVYPGEANKGIFVKLTEDALAGPQLAGEEYQITHPTASLNGLLRGALWVAICDTLFITCRGGSRQNDNGKRLRSIVEYKEESWLTKAKYFLEGVIYEYDMSKGEAGVEEFKTIKEVPSDRIVGTFEGSWKGKITWKRKGEKVRGWLRSWYLGAQTLMRILFLLCVPRNRVFSSISTKSSPFQRLFVRSLHKMRWSLARSGRLSLQRSSPKTSPERRGTSRELSRPSERRLPTARGTERNSSHASSRWTSPMGGRVSPRRAEVLWMERRSYWVMAREKMYPKRKGLKPRRLLWARREARNHERKRTTKAATTMMMQTASPAQKAN
jgi:hypothetical protein